MKKIKDATPCKPTRAHVHVMNGFWLEFVSGCVDQGKQLSCMCYTQGSACVVQLKWLNTACARACVRASMTVRA